MSVVDLRRVSGLVDLPKYAEAFLEFPEHELRTTLSFTCEEGTVRADAYMVIHNTARGPGKGGIRLASDVDVKETGRLAELMTYKCALANIPFGGAKSSIKLDPKTLTPNQRKALFQAYSVQLRPYIGSGLYVPAPDMATGPSEMATIMGCIGPRESVTGKPISIGGLQGRLEATGFGVSVIAKLAAQDVLGKDLSECTVAIQGFGNVGQWSALLLAEAGAKVIAISDIFGGAYSETGFTPNQLAEATVEDLGNIAEKMDRDNLLSVQADILIPAAAGHVLDSRTSEGVKAGVIIEAANDPVTEDGNEILSGKGIRVVPDILANAGGVVASYAEWRQGKSGEQLETEDTRRIIENRLTRSYTAVRLASKDLNVDYRTASHVIAVQQVALAMADRNWLSG